MDKRRHHILKQVPLQLVAILNQLHSAQALQLDITANRRKNVVPYRHLATHLKMLNRAYLLDGPVIVLDVAVTTHKTIDLVFSTQVFKLKRDMQKPSRTATASATLCQNGVAEVTHEQSAHSPAARCDRSVTAGAPPAGAQDHSRTFGEDQCQ